MRNFLKYKFYFSQDIKVTYIYENTKEQTKLELAAHQNQLKEIKKKSFYKRPLPKHLIRFGSEKSKHYMLEALQEGTMECYFNLAEQFITQMLPSTCGTTTLAMVLNALEIDPQTQWKGIWRWFSEENLKCSNPENLKSLNFEEFIELARCNSASVKAFYSSEEEKQNLEKNIAGFNTFRDCLIASCRIKGFYMVVNNSRAVLGQTGSGHYSPIGGFHANSNSALLLDVARFKYPSYWLNLDLLYKSLLSIDQKTEKSRGFVLLSKRIIDGPYICRLYYDFKGMNRLKDFFFNENYVFKTHSERIDENIELFIVKRMKHLIEDLRFLLIYYMFELSCVVNTESKCSIHLTEKSFVGDKLKKELKELELLNILDEMVKQNKINKKTCLLTNLVFEFLPDFSIEVLALLFLAIPKDIFNKNLYKNEKLLERFLELVDENQYKDLTNVSNEVRKVKEIMGFHEI